LARRGEAWSINDWEGVKGFARGLARRGEARPGKAWHGVLKKLEEIMEQAKRYPGSKQALQAVIDEGLTHGDFVTREWYCKNADINPNDRAAFLSSFYGKNGFRRMLMDECCFVLRALGGGRWLILEPKEGVDYTAENIPLKIRKSCKRGLDEFSCYDDNQLDDQRITKKRNKMASFSRILEFTRKRKVIEFEEMIHKNGKKPAKPTPLFIECKIERPVIDIDCIQMT